MLWYWWSFSFCEAWGYVRWRRGSVELLVFVRNDYGGFEYINIVVLLIDVLWEDEACR